MAEAGTLAKAAGCDKVGAMKGTEDAGPAELREAIEAEIAAAGGRIPFARFMELALYHPRLGYYTAGPERIGRAGDFFTSVSVGPLYGRILAREFRRLRRELGEPADFEVVEFGGRHGQLRADVLAEAPELRYSIVEAGGAQPPERIVGCVFSNEFLDALPVHRVTAAGGEWRELYVTATGEAARPFAEVVGPLSTPRLAAALRELPVRLMDGYTTEVNLRALDWLEDVAWRRVRGFVLTVDYGHERADYFAPHRRAGTMLCYHRHTRHADPFCHVGEQDLTAHVEFTSLIEHGPRCGLATVQFTDQARFLLEAGADLIAEIAARDAGRPSAERNAVHQLTHPSLMGRTFKVLLQRKEEGQA